MMQVYAVRSDLAVALYQKAFDAPIVSSYPNPDGTYYHVELDVFGQILAIAEASVAGSFSGEEAVLRKAYDALSEDATILFPLGPIDFSPLASDLIDRFGVRWCLFLD